MTRGEAHEDGSLFTVTHSILESDALLSHVVSRYDLGHAHTCRLISTAVHDTYLVIARLDDRYALRVYRTGWEPTPDILYELNLLTHLERKGIQVSAPLRQTNGRFVQRIEAPEGPRDVVIFNWAPGEAASGEDSEALYRHGRALGLLHGGMDDFSSIHDRPARDLEYWIDGPLRLLEPLAKEHQQEWAYILDLTGWLRERISLLDAGRLTWGVCHGEPEPDNTRHLGERTPTFFDFDACGPGWRAADLAAVRWRGSCVGHDPGDRSWNRFMVGYAETHSFSEEDGRAVMLFVPLREIWHTAVAMLIAGSLGWRRVETSWAESIGRLSAWETEYGRGAEAHHSHEQR